MIWHLLLEIKTIYPIYVSAKIKNNLIVFLKNNLIYRLFYINYGKISDVMEYV